MLGYGSVLSSNNTAKVAITQKYLGLENPSDANNPLVYATSQTVNMLPLLAYQKIYYDFFSNSQWEKHLAYAYNVDYWTGSGSIALAVNMVKLRYANYPKDYFMGMLPSSQYGSVAVLPAINSAYEPTSIAFGTDSRLGSYATLTNPAGGTSVVASPTNSSSSAKSSFLNSDLSASLIVTGKKIGRAHV